MKFIVAINIWILNWRHFLSTDKKCSLLITLKQIEWKCAKYGLEFARHLQKLQSSVPGEGTVQGIYVYKQNLRWCIEREKHFEQQECTRELRSVHTKELVLEAYCLLYIIYVRLTFPYFYTSYSMLYWLTVAQNKGEGFHPLTSFFHILFLVVFSLVCIFLPRGAPHFPKDTRT